MKMRSSKILLTGLIVLLPVLFFGCNNILTPFSSENSRPENSREGTVTVSFSTGRAALSPMEMDFDVYEFTFLRTAGGNPETFYKSKNEAFSFSLNLGVNYTLEVKAYTKSWAPENLAAQGKSANFTVTTNTQVQVKLNGILSGGAEGTFTYSVSCPADAKIDEFFLLINEVAPPVDLSAGAGSTSISGSVDVAAGWYFLIIRLSKEGSEAGYANAVAIYPGQTTFYGTDADPIVFTDADFKAVAGTIVTEWHGFDVAGWSHYYNNDRASPGFNQDSNYDTARAVGTWYETFIDGNNNTWSDVLKLDPPGFNDPAHFRYDDTDLYNGYMHDTVAMTYETVDAGLYSLSMYIWVENSAEDVSVWWSNTGAFYLDEGAPYEKSWRVLAGSPYGNVTRREWLPIQGTFVLRANEEIGIIPRFLNNESGLRDAVIYIRDINLELVLNGIQVIISPQEDLTFAVGGFQKLSANKDVTWSSSNESIATVDENGIVTATGVGNAVIKAIPAEEGAVYGEKSIRVIANGNGGKYIALTYDDGPEDDYTPLFIQALNRYNAHATFFVMGKKVADDHVTTRMYTDGGQELGNHTYWHWQEPEFRPTTQKTIDEIKAEMLMASDLIENVTGHRPTVFRAPTLRYTHNEFNWDYPAEEDLIHHQYADKMEEAARQMGFPIIDTTGHHEGDYDWDSSRNEFRPGQLRNPEELTHKAMSLAKPWGILLTHDGNRTNVANNAKALPLMLEALYAEGYEVMSVSQIAAKSKELRGTPDLEPGRIYYDFETIPAHVTGITVSSGGSIVSYMDGDPMETRPVGISMLNTGGTLNLSVNMTGGQQTPFWYSDNPSVATVDKFTGLVTAVNNGFTTIRVGAGGRRALVNVAVGYDIKIDTVTEWEGIQDGWAGWYGETLNDKFYPSGAQVTKLNSWQAPGDANVFSNVLKLAPPAAGQDYYIGPEGGSIAVNFMIPLEGQYSFSVDIWIDTSTCITDYLEKFKLAWWNASKILAWRDMAILPVGVIPAGWYTFESSTPLFMDAGSTIGLYMRNGGDAEGLRGATVYLKNLKLTRVGAEKDVIDIRSEGSQVTIPTINTWEGIQDGWAGWNGNASNGITTDKFYPSGAQVTKLNSWQAPGDTNVFTNVLKLAPPAPGQDYYRGPDGGSIAVNYRIPLEGQYSFSVDIWVDTSTCIPDFLDKFCLIWWNASEKTYWNALAAYPPREIPAGWYTLVSSVPLQMDAGSTIGLYMRNGGDAEGLRGATVYLKNFKLERVGAGAPVIDIKSNSSTVSLSQWQTVTTWAAIDKAGSPGNPAPGQGGPYISSNARWSIDSDNVLKLYPPAGGYATGGTIAVAYTVPFNGVYTLSMDVRVEPHNGEAVDICWYDWSNFYMLVRMHNVDQAGSGFVHLSGTTRTQGEQQISIDAGTVIGLLTSLYSGDTEGLRDATIYIRNFKLELEGANVPIIDIRSTEIETVNQIVTLKWDNTGLSLLPQAPITIAKGESVTLNAPAGVIICQWYVEGWPVPGATGPSFKFDSNDFVDPGTYTVSLWAGSNGGDAIVITVVGE